MILNSPKRLIMTVGDSRVGKSTVTKLLIDLWLAQDKKIRVYNHDNFYKLQAYVSLVKIEVLDFFKGDTDKIFNDLNKSELDIIMVDMPGQHIDKICKYIDKVELFNILLEYNWRLTFLQPISHRIDCITHLNELISYATNQANYIVVKNYHFDTRFIEYQQIVQNKIQLIGGREIELSALHREHYKALEKVCKPYSQCCTDKSIYVIYRTYIYHWIKNFNNSVLGNAMTSKYLGLG
ncbi:ATP-binding protein [Anabaena minutissima FACHB-250]|nr:ATP-binding protein [Anabaena minutissima FACHB-250]